MNRQRVKSIVFAAVILVSLWEIYRYHIRLEAWIWHVRHGTAVSFGAYIVPVPSNWYLDDSGGSGLLLVRLDTADQTALRKYKSHAVISLFSERPPKDLDRWVSAETSLSKLGNEQQTFSLPGDRISCVGGGKLSTPGLLDIDPDTWSCQSAGELNLIIAAAGPDMKQVWEIVSGIHKHS